MLKKLLALSLAGGVMVACSSNKEPETKAISSAPVSSAPVTTEEVAPVAAPVVVNPNSVYYAFNKFDINSEYNGLLQVNANHLTTKHGAKVQVQGNTDDIGSVEYNLALGQKRANAVKAALIASGADKHQIETVSYGKLKPKFDNTNDQGRSENRRADIVYKNEQPSGYSLDSNGIPSVDGAFYNGTVQQGVLN